MKRFPVFILLVLFFYSPIFSQLDSLKINAETGFTVGLGDYSPLWINANNFGKISNSKNQAFISAGLAKSLKNNKLLDYGYGIEGFGRIDTSWHAWLHQGYLEGKIGFVKAYAGLKEETFGVRDTLLSTGSFVWSGNARPMPKVTISTNGFTNIPFTHGWVQFQSLFSHGWFENDRYVKNVWLHHKNMYLRFANNTPISFTMGLEHFVMWGGVSTDKSRGEDGVLPSDWETFRSILTGRELLNITDTSSLWSERNAIGNHVGSWNFALRFKIQEKQLLIYKQHPIEDGSGRRLENWRDGIWGISFNTEYAPVRRIVGEFIYTDDQGQNGNFENFKYDPDNYFNNYLYKDGWSYYDGSIGTPLISKQTGQIGFANNRIAMVYLAFHGEAIGLHYTLKTNYSINRGTFYTEYKPLKEYYSLYLNLGKQIGDNWMASCFSGFDLGELYGKNIGFGIKISYNTILNKN